MSGGLPRQASAFDLDGKVAVVTGALGLLGRQFSEALLDAGAVVVVADLDGDRCRAFAEELGKTFGRRAFGQGVDITSPPSLVKLRDTLRGHGHGSIDIVVNSAALNDVFDEGRMATLSRFEHYPLEVWKRSLDVNLTGTFLVCQVLGSAMVEQGHGSIVNVASTYGLVAPDQRIYARPDGTQVFWKSAAYAAGKAGVVGLTRFLAAYWGATGVRVNALVPGGVEAGQERHFVRNYSSRTPMGRMANPAEMRGAVVYLASDASSYVTGSNLVVDGGWTAW